MPHDLREMTCRGIAYLILEFLSAQDAGSDRFIRLFDPFNQCAMLSRSTRLGRLRMGWDGWMLTDMGNSNDMHVSKSVADYNFVAVNFKFVLAGGFT